MSRGTETVFDQLHGLVADSLIQQIEVYTKNRDPDTGKLAPLPLPPALLAQAIKFLKDNGIDSPSRGKKVDEALPPDLPSFADVVAEHQGLH